MYLSFATVYNLHLKRQLVAHNFWSMTRKWRSRWRRRRLRRWSCCCSSCCTTFSNVTFLLEEATLNEPKYSRNWLGLLKWSHYPSISVQLFVLSFKIHFFCSNRLQWSIILFLQSNCFDSLFGWKDTGMPHASASTTLPGAVERTFENLLEFCTTLNLPIEKDF